MTKTLREQIAEHICNWVGEETYRSQDAKYRYDKFADEILDIIRPRFEEIEKMATDAISPSSFEPDITHVHYSWFKEIIRLCQLDEPEPKEDEVKAKFANLVNDFLSATKPRQEALDIFYDRTIKLIKESKND